MRMQLELQHTVSLSLNTPELDSCPAAALAVRALATAAYVQYRGLPVQSASADAVAPRDIKLANLSASLGLEKRVTLAVSAMQQYQVESRPHLAARLTEHILLLASKASQAFTSLMC